MKKITIFILFLICSHSFSQSPNNWIRSWGFSHYPNTYGNRLAVDNLGHLYVACNRNENGKECLYTIKYNNNGDTAWYVEYHDSANANDYATGITLDDSNNVYVICISGDFNSGQNYGTIKYNKNGVLQWIQIYKSGSGNTTSFPDCIQVDHSGNVYVTGYSPLSGFNYDYCTIKYNSNGVQQWIQRYNGPGNGYDVAVCLKLDTFKNVYVAGFSTGTNGLYDICTIKYNTNGVQQWIQRKSIIEGYINVASDMTIDQNGNTYITGFTYFTNSHEDIFTLKYNSSGVQQWLNIYDGPAHKYNTANAIKLDMEGNVIITGSSYVDSSHSQIATIKYNSSGIQQWVKFYDSTLSDENYGKAIAIDQFNNIYITGYTRWAATYRDYTSLQYSPQGILQWSQRYNSGGSNDDISESIVLDNIGNIFINGRCGTTSTNFENITIKYPSLIVGTNKTSSTIPDEYFLSQNYPNPFNPSTKIKFSLPLPSSKGVLSDKGGAMEVTLKIYDILGKEITTLFSSPWGRIGGVAYEVEWNASNYPSGIYFYKLTTSGEATEFTETKRMVLLK